MYSWAENMNNKFLKLFIRTIANIVLPVYYRFTRTPSTNSKQNNCLTVSLTSIPIRISKLWIVIESILRQTHNVNRIVLYLSTNNFPYKEKDLPTSLLKLKRHGLEIYFYDEDLRSYKKFYYAFQDSLNSIVITIDDDIIYPPNMIEKLINKHQEHPYSVIARYAHHVDLNIPYNQWNNVFSTNPSNSIFFGSGGGTLFPIVHFHKDFFRKDLFKDLCKYADDIWLNIFIRLSGLNVYLLNGKSTHILNIQTFNDKRLTTINCDNNQNDVQLHQVLNYLLQEYEIKVDFQ